MNIGYWLWNIQVSNWSHYIGLKGACQYENQKSYSAKTVRIFCHYEESFKKNKQFVDLKENDHFPIDLAFDKIQKQYEKNLSRSKKKYM